MLATFPEEACTLSPRREVRRELDAGLLEAVPLARPLHNQLSPVRTSHVLPPFADPIFELLAHGLKQLLKEAQVTRP